MSNRIKKGRAESIIKESLSNFIMEVSNNSSFITIMFIEYNESGTLVKVHCSVFPNEKASEVADFLVRKSRDAKEYLKKHTNLKYVPSVRFQVGELGKQVFE